MDATSSPPRTSTRIGLTSYNGGAEQRATLELGDLRSAKCRRREGCCGLLVARFVLFAAH
jgi:hypothetical protein